MVDRSMVSTDVPEALVRGRSTRAFAAGTRGAASHLVGASVRGRGRSATTERAREVTSRQW